MEKSKVIEKLFEYILNYSYLLLPLAFLINAAKKRGVVPLVIGIYGLIFFFLLDRFPYVTKDLKKLYQSSYTTLEYGFFAFLFWYNIGSKKIRNFIIIFSLCFLTFQVAYFFNGKASKLDSVPIGLETILILIYIFYFFYEFTKKSTSGFIYTHYLFWISVGILIYLGGSFFFYILINHLSREEIDAFGNLTYVADTIKNFLFAIAVFIYARYPNNENGNKRSESVPYLDMI